MQDPREASKVIGQTAQLGFHQVLGPAQPGQRRPPRLRVVSDEDGQRILVGRQLLDGNGINAAAEQPQDSVGQ